MSKPITKQIGRYTYSLRPFPFDDHVKISAILAQTAGPGADVFAAMVSGRWGGMGKTIQDLGAAINLSASEGLISTLCEHLRVHNNPGKKKAWAECKVQHVRSALWSGFDGETLEGYEALYWVLESNFKDFLAAVIERAQLLLGQQSDAEVTAESTDSESETGDDELSEPQNES